MPSALSHDPAITVPGASTDNAVVIFDGTGGTGFGNSTIVVDSGGNGRIGLATDTNLITLTNETVTVAGAVTASGVVTGATLVGTLTTAAQTNVTSLSTLTALQVDNININGNIISSTAGTDLFITPLGGQQLILDGTIIIDAGAVTGATSITSTEFVGGGVGLTALVAGNITSGGTFLAQNGSALTALNGSAITSGTLPAARIAADSIVEGKLDVSNGPTNGQFLQAQSGEGGGLTWAAAAGGDVVDDTTPQLGAHLDMNDFGLDFSNQTASADADVFDEYEEGSWTPNFTDQSGSDAEGQTYSAQIGTYTKIGNRCLFSMNLINTGIGSLTTTNSGRFGQLPFAMPALEGYSVATATSAVIAQGTNFTAGSEAGQTFIVMSYWNSTQGAIGAKVSELSVGISICISGQYRFA